MTVPTTLCILYIFDTRSIHIWPLHQNLVFHHIRREFCCFKIFIYLSIMSFNPVFLLVESFSTFMTTPGLMCTPKQSLWSSLCTMPTSTSSASLHSCLRPQPSVSSPCSAIMWEPHRNWNCWTNHVVCHFVFPPGAFQFRSELQSVRLYQSTGGLHIFVMASEAIYFLFIIYYMFGQVWIY